MQLEGTNRQYNVLTLDGGGVRGLITLRILSNLEERLSLGDPNYSITKEFDLICGTSAGGLIALALAAGKTARQLQDKMMEDIIKETFKDRPEEAILFNKTKYDAKNLEDVFTKHLG